ncbi:hypothetical protein PGTUg99_024479 [Puccinia graminis f. sp. tritici]|uniref:Uncharacterized protein n=1 Tax=Puccinia graminis f. sp. tritici TaxID=56615 RepID=A0A5B0PFK7_PUCGR|nr:hypothetical protein PGTUg99_024479 [Puccinia graminis f. sp. tritici]
MKTTLSKKASNSLALASAYEQQSVYHNTDPASGSLSTQQSYNLAVAWGIL